VPVQCYSLQSVNRPRRRATCGGFAIIWLFGGGGLFRTLLEAGLVDTVEPAVVPVLLGDGIPMLPSPALRTKLLLSGHRLYQKSGIVLLEYTISR